VCENGLKKFPTVSEKCQKTLGGIFFDSHCTFVVKQDDRKIYFRQGL